VGQSQICSLLNEANVGLFFNSGCLLPAWLGRFFLLSHWKPQIMSLHVFAQSLRSLIYRLDLRTEWHDCRSSVYQNDIW